MSRVVRRILTGASFVGAVALLLVLDTYLPDRVVPWAAASMLAFLGARELARMGSLRPLGLTSPLAAGVIGASVVAYLVGVQGGGPLAGHPLSQLLSIAFVALVAALAGTFGRSRSSGEPPDPGRRRRWGVWLAVWISMLLGLVAVDAWWGTRGVVALVLLSKIGDIFGYFVGRAIGKRHPFPSISPGKTTAGCVASLVAGLAAGALVVPLELLPAGTLGWFGGVVAGLLLNLAAQAGDLAESWVKRRSGVKDSSTIFGPAGGVLDVVDSLLLTVPAALVSWPLLF